MKPDVCREAFEAAVAKASRKLDLTRSTMTGEYTRASTAQEYAEFKEVFESGRETGRREKGYELEVWFWLAAVLVVTLALTTSHLAGWIK